MENFTESKVYKTFKEYKEKQQNCIILMRCGNFYETYDEDASILGRVTGVTVTSLNPNVSNSPKMAGFPYHALDIYLPKIVRYGNVYGKRVAIAEA